MNLLKLGLSKGDELTVKRLRDYIDELDTEIADKLRARKEVVKVIQQVKDEYGVSVIDEDREKEIVERLRLENPEIPDTIDRVWTVIFNQVRENYE